MQDFGNVFGLGFTLEGFSFFVEAIFIGIYAYGWDRLSPRLHFLSGIPIAIAGVTGSMFVIAVNAWMNHPTGFTLAGGSGFRAVNACRVARMWFTAPAPGGRAGRERAARLRARGSFVSFGRPDDQD